MAAAELPDYFNTPEAQDWFAAEQDAAYLLGEHGWLIDRNKGHIPFEMWPHVRELIKVLYQHRNVIVLKARQVGVSETLAGVGIHSALFEPGSNVLFFSKDGKSSTDLLAKARYFHQHFPEHIKTSTLGGKDNTYRLDFPVFSSVIQSFAATRNAGRSETARRVGLDEFAHQKWAEHVYLAVKPTIDAGGSITIVSTANGVGNRFYDMWMAAGGDHCPYPFPREQTIWVGPPGENGYVPVFIPWWAPPWRTDAWFAEVTKDMKPWEIAQEYPSSAQEAFVATGRPVFEAKDLVPARDVGIITPDPFHPFRRISSELLTLYSLPVKGHRYAIGADPAEGLVRGDYSCASVLDVTAGREAAMLHGTIEPDRFAELLHMLGMVYGGKMAIERNNHGHAVLMRVRQLRIEDARKGKEKRYTLYHTVDVDRQTPVAGEQRWANQELTPGWLTTTKTKPMLIDGLEFGVRSRELRLTTPALFAEMRVYRKFDDGTTGPSGSSHDDRIMAVGIAWHMRQWLSRQEVEMRRVPAGGLHAG